MDVVPASFVSRPGFIVMAAYKPDPILFARQIQSIQRQTVTNFRCIISADGSAESVSALLHTITDGDARFSVLGYEDRLGFYGNFERALLAVPSEAAWVALADQDDSWDADKLEKLLPLLDDYSVVSCQARVVRYPEDKVVASSTHRRNSPIIAFTLDNQYTGSQMVFRRSVLDVALPFPRLETPAQVHDHWIAVVGAHVGGSLVTNETAQDYVQHGGNVIGEAERGFNPLASLRNARRIAQKYAGSASPRAMAMVTYRVGVQWREVMMLALGERIDSDKVDELVRVYGPDRRFGRTMRSIWGAVRRKEASARSAAEYTAGWVAGAVFRLRGR